MMRYRLDRLRNHQQENRLVRRRFIIALFFLVILVLILVARMYYLQVMLYRPFLTQSNENRIRLLSLSPNRGLIYDDKNRLIAKNIPSFSVTLTRERVQDVNAVLAVLRPILHLDQDTITDFKKRFKVRRPSTPVPLIYGLTQQQIAEIAVNHYRLSGVDVQAQLIRYYPFNGLFVHSLGYVGRINDRELAKLDPERYAGMDVIGKIGIEKSYESTLMGRPGYQEVETDANGKIVQVLKKVDPLPGKNLHLYLNIDLQKTALAALGKHRGAIVALDPNTGGVLAMVSTPDFNPNDFVTGISSKEYQTLRNDIDHPLYNRASLGEYPPASTLKPMLAYAALDSGAISPRDRIFDPGYFRLPNTTHKYRNWKHSGHGWVGLQRAIQVSNDTFFYQAAVKMGIDIIHKELTKVFGFGNRTGLDIDEKRAGLIPSRQWKKRVKKTIWYPGETVIAGIGQGYMLATPMQMAKATAVIANHGRMVEPSLVKSPNRQALLTTPITSKNTPKQKKNWDIIISAMQQVVSTRQGTGYWRVGRYLKGYTMAGKTGTAQVVGIAQDARYDADQLAERHRDHSWFVGFAPVKHPKIVVAVIVENGADAQEYSAGPVAKKVMDAWLLPNQSNKVAKNNTDSTAGKHAE